MSLNQRNWLIGVSAIVMVAAIVWLLSRGYGKTSAEGYRYATALFSACNQQDKARLRKISELISSANEAGELEPDESRWLQDIVDRGLAGDWDSASRNVRRLMEAQQERAAPLPAAP